MSGRDPTPATEATGIYRRLTEAVSDAHLPDLALSLNNLANRPAEVALLSDGWSPPPREGSRSVLLRRVLRRAPRSGEAEDEDGAAREVVKRLRADDGGRGVQSEAGPRGKKITSPGGP